MKKTIVKNREEYRKMCKVVLAADVYESAGEIAASIRSAPKDKNTLREYKSYRLSAK